MFLIMDSSTHFQAPPLTVYLLWFITNRKYAFFYVFHVILSPDNIILIYLIKINHIVINDHD